MDIKHVFVPADFDGDNVRLVETKGNQFYKNVLWRKRSKTYEGGPDAFDLSRPAFGAFTMPVSLQ